MGQVTKRTFSETLSDLMSRGQSRLLRRALAKFDAADLAADRLG
jgi:hypothetical protein